MRKNKGFTLIELVVVIVILGIISAVAIPTYVDLRTTALDNSLKANLGTIRSSIALQHSSNLLLGNDTWPATITSAIFDDGNVPMDPIASTNNVATSSTDPIGALTGVTTGGWIYNNSTGEVRCNHVDYSSY
jgi:prepilin-type N-terminal cleavage/methylation domain-containing protein